LRVLLVSVPAEVIKQYTSIAKSLKIESSFLEAETFSLIRALSEENKIISIIDIGTKTTSCSIVEGKILKISRSLDLSEDEFVQVISSSLRIEPDLAEELKRKYGLLHPEVPEGKEIRDILTPMLNSLLKDIEQTFLNFKNTEGKEVEKIILAGGGAKLPGLLQYFQNYFKKKVEIANPFKRIDFPAILEEIIKEIGPSFSIAVGLALRAFE
jgi:type IV pilus assembly protein PilM